MKRGESGLSLLVAVDKPSGMTSHDVVNSVRRIFGERRVGHTGTLDPMACGVLPVCVGPATRLDRFMTGHDKRYRVTIAFGCETTTDDAQGEPTETGTPSGRLHDEDFAREYLRGIVGSHLQVPPQYSAVSIGGKRAYQLARAGREAQLEPRPIEVYEADLVECDSNGAYGTLCWSVDFSVSKGTYVRSLARDIGRQLGCPAHVAALQRRRAGTIGLEHCVSLETLESRREDAALDPVEVLGLRYAFADDAAKAIASGAALRGLTLNEPVVSADRRACTCAGGVVASAEAPGRGELVSVVVENRLKALYEFAEGGVWKPACVFSTGVFRG